MGAQISAKDVKALRDATNAGMMDCKKALEESSGDMKAAEEWLRKKGLSDAGRKGARVAAEGAVISYVHPGNKLAVVVEVNCESDFVARGEDFQNFVKDIAMQIAAANPLWVKREEVPADAVAKEKDVLKAQVVESGKPENIAEKIVEGKINKWFSDVVLLEQPWVKEPKMTIEELRASMVQKTGENVSIRRFTRYVLGEGIEKKVTDLAAEVAKMTKS
ncbi:MAG: translation elongation factor Ts [Deltaproteobacteria bacterium]|jgi:elongation factor Ts|nr:translation elongation factor Ts [Deltaproteobacteria bacterium]